ncbi:MAG TPA: translation initiation factor IF-2 N-terminal domain-containing protein, partial [Thermoleophilaceae bacterium]|nr:translation initiation factor IF-2 N-terminal domain-containing protein [Thermoleophilaceae bacterium]
MAKKRVHEIAKQRGIPSKEALAILQKAGLKVTAAASSVEEADAARAFGNGAGAAADEPVAERPADDTPATGAPAAKAPTKEADGAEAPAGTSDGV